MSNQRHASWHNCANEDVTKGNELLSLAAKLPELIALQGVLPASVPDSIIHQFPLRVLCATAMMVFYHPDIPQAEPRARGLRQIAGT